MRVAAFLLRASLRRRWAALLGTGAIFAVGLAVTLSALVAADRTDRVYGEYLASAEVGDLVVNPALATKSVDRAMRALPEVASVRSDNLYLGSLVQTEPGRFGDLAMHEVMLQVRGSTDGRFVDRDRPVVTEGHFATGPREVFLNDDERTEVERALDRRIRVGDRLPMAFWPSRLSLQTAGAPEPDEIVRPIEVVTVQVAGFGRLPDEVLPDDLYPRQRLTISPDLARRFGCLDDFTASMTAAEAEAALFAEGCASTHRIFSVQLRDGASPSDLRRSFDRVTARLQGDVPAELAEQGVAYTYYVDDRADQDAAVRQGTRPLVVSLRVFGLLAGAATAAVTAVATWRLGRRDDAVQRTLRAVGSTSVERSLALVAPFAAVLLGGIAAAIPLAFVGSRVGPVGTIRSLTPAASGSLPIRVVLPVVALAVGLVALLLAGLARSASRRTALVAPRPRVGGLGRRLRWSNRPAFTEGVRAGLDPRGTDGGAVVVAGAALVVAAIVAATVFGTNLSSLVRNPDRYGWPWDTAVLTNGGYGGADPAKVAARLDDDPDVAGWTLHGLDPALRIGKRSVPAVIGFAARSARGGHPDPAFRVTDGRVPVRPGEVLLGAATARELDAEVGDALPIRSQLTKARRVEVVGIGALPSVGLFLSKRAGLGTGAYVVVDADPGDPNLYFPAGLTAVDLRPGTDADAFARRIARAETWDAYGSPPYASVASSPPPGIVDAGRMRTGPLSLAALLGAGLILGLGLSIGVSVHDRRRELAILQALGFTRRDLRETVLWQALATCVVGVIVGVPVGLAAGRTSWRAFADHLDLGTSVSIPAGAVVAVAAGIVVLGFAAALAPAASAARTRAAAVLNDAT